ncbi:hypothetical protein [Streptomyces sp. NPDC053720]|uniref:hypothetical protein n=1 Tax=Streptomyces sp. NPDC053720 TaxID=3154855 RepID=UPI003432D47E
MAAVAAANWNHTLSSGSPRSRAGTFHIRSISGTLTISDQECADGNSSKADDTCSGVAQQAGAFAKALGG